MENETKQNAKQTHKKYKIQNNLNKRAEINSIKMY